jgi:hypothetical protein
MHYFDMHLIEIFTHPSKVIKESLEYPSVGMILFLLLLPIVLYQAVFVILGVGIQVQSFFFSIIDAILVASVLTLIVYGANVLLANTKAVQGNWLGLFQANSVFWLYHVVLTILYGIILLLLPLQSTLTERASGTLTDLQFIQQLQTSFLNQDMNIVLVLMVLYGIAFLTVFVYQFYSWFLVYRQTLQKDKIISFIVFLAGMLLFIVIMGLKGLILSL